jgi:hypothetical protein
LRDFPFSTKLACPQEVSVEEEEKNACVEVCVEGCPEEKEKEEACSEEEEEEKAFPECDFVMMPNRMLLLGW